MKKGVIIAIVVVVLIGAGIAAFFLLRKKKMTPKEKFISDMLNNIGTIANGINGWHRVNKTGPMTAQDAIDYWNDRENGKDGWAKSDWQSYNARPFWTKLEIVPVVKP